MTSMTLYSLKNDHYWTLPLTEERKRIINKIFFLLLIQKDKDGSEHYSILAPRQKAEQWIKNWEKKFECGEK
jgi:hypothetical protein